MTRARRFSPEVRSGQCEPLEVGQGCPCEIDLAQTGWRTIKILHWPEQ